MDSNREEAERCCMLAEKAEEQGDLHRAVRLYTKALNMYPVKMAEIRLRALKEKMVNQTTHETGDHNHQSRSSRSMHQQQEEDNNKPSEAKGAGGAFPKEQIEMIA